MPRTITLAANLLGNIHATAGGMSRLVQETAVSADRFFAYTYFAAVKPPDTNNPEATHAA
jgi:hypothetical protein